MNTGSFTDNRNAYRNQLYAFFFIQWETQFNIFHENCFKNLALTTRSANMMTTLNKIL